MKASYVVFHFESVVDTIYANPELIVTGVLPVIGGAILVGAGVFLIGFGAVKIWSKMLSIQGHQAERPAPEE